MAGLDAVPKGINLMLLGTVGRGANPLPVSLLVQLVGGSGPKLRGKYGLSSLCTAMSRMYAAVRSIRLRNELSSDRRPRLAAYSTTSQ
jgi:hypothetical protein